ncbi:autophagy-related protein 2 homolog B [Caerostris extrusa]|uniref:Autophagy-related protein 2 n=1 Tax=Caerostris extrusa TaxID=172846 RepID=A0AAV4MX06_CAEEX|nr:autophagy-related protein 2 homolog B [Caerostris extrusa]
MFTSQFPAECRTCSRSSASSEYMDASPFIPGSPEMPPTHSSFPVKKTEPDFEDPILISKFSGKQEIKLKLKQNQNVNGPKVDVEFNFGALNLFLIPQQVHMLVELFLELLRPGSISDAKRKSSLSVTNKPMKAADYALVEQELLLRHQQKFDVPSKSLKNQHGWSSHSLDESDDEFQLAMHNRFETETPNTTFNDGIHYAVALAVIQSQTVLDLVIDDFLKQEAPLYMLCYKIKCQNYRISMTFSQVKNPYQKLCATNHLRLMASSISVDGSQKSSCVQCTSDFAISMMKFQVLECLFNSANLTENVQSVTYVPILVCDQKISMTDSLKAELSDSCMNLKYQLVQYSTQRSMTKPPANRLDIQFGPLTTEIDISLTDRIQTLLNFQNFNNIDIRSNKIDSDSTRYSPKTEITISSSDVTVNLRFPIPDLRSVHDMDRVPWWQQNLHPEILILEIKGVTMMTTLDNDVKQSKYEIQCRDLHALFQQSEQQKPISFLRVSVDPDVDEIAHNNGFGLPRLVIHKTMKASGRDLDPGLEEQEELFSHSITDVLMSNLDTKPSPFSSTSVFYLSKLENENSHENKDSDKISADLEQVIKPADKETIIHFTDQIISKSEYFYEFSFPTVNMVLPSKEFFELLYNRLGNDLLLWQKTVLTPKAPYDPNGFKVHVPGLELNSSSMKDIFSENYSIFRPFSHDSNSDSEEDVNYYSFSELSVRQKSSHKKNENDDAFTRISIQIQITKGNVTIHTPILDNSNKVIPDVCGKLLLAVEDGQLFIASSYQGNENEAYFCILADRSTLYHNALMKPEKLSIVEPLNGSQPQNIQRIIHKTDEGLCLKKSTSAMHRDRDMLKIAMHIVCMPKQQLKSFNVAIDISDATLRHYMHVANQMWVNQLMDYLKVRDLPVSGYVPYVVVTEFHLNLTNCAIDYRPLNLPLRSVITVENFNMSCNIAATTPSFLFRLVSEEMRLFISNDVTVKLPNLKKVNNFCFYDYICVIESGFIDITIRTSTNEKNEAVFEFCVSNNRINVRTCADSFKALIDLLIHVNESGDLDKSESEENKVTIEKEDPTDKKVHLEELDYLMAEAMKDVTKDMYSEQMGENSGKIHEAAKINTDDEFCILENDPGVGLMPPNGQPQVRILTDEEIHIVENHFSVPQTKTDDLKAPTHYPKPLVLFSLREMSLYWDLYGGNDFKVPGKKKNKNKKKLRKDVSFSDEKSVDFDINKSTATFCKVSNVTCISKTDIQYSTEQVTIDQSKEHCLDSWLRSGGANRDQDVLMQLVLKKLKFQKEIYPEDTEQSVRNILLIHDVEIIDKLKSSNINTFFYQYVCQKIPRQSSANMIDVKALYTRQDPKSSSEECTLEISCKPMRLNIDQDSLLFLIGFFQEVFNFSPEEIEDSKDKGNASTQVKDMSFSQHISDSNVETFYKSFKFYPEVLIRIDYQGKKVSMAKGAVTGVLMGLAQLNASEIVLKKLQYRHGLLGHQKVLAYATNEWSKDILKNQLPSILGGIGPMHAFVQLFQGVKDFIYLPLSQYKKDGQIMRGFQRGTLSLSTSALMALLELSSGAISILQGFAIFGYDMLSPGPSKFQKSKKTRRQITQPADGVNDMSRDMYIAASVEHEHKGVPGAIGGVLRQIPKTIIKPVIVGTEATNYVIDGVRHQLMPDAHQEDRYKWRTKKC